MNSKLSIRHLAVASTFALTSLASLAQTAPGDSGYLDFTVGRSQFDLTNGTGLYNSESRDTSYRIAYGWRFLPFLGGEVGYLDAGKVARGGGETKARAVNLSLVASVPVGPFSLFAKGGGAYSETKTTSLPLSGVQEGNASGWGPAYGAGVALNVLPNMAVVAQWERTKMHFAGLGKDDVENSSVGLRLRF